MLDHIYDTISDYFSSAKATYNITFLYQYTFTAYHVVVWPVHRAVFRNKLFCGVVIAAATTYIGPTIHAIIYNNRTAVFVTNHLCIDFDL